VAVNVEMGEKRRCECRQPRLTQMGVPWVVAAGMERGALGYMTTLAAGLSSIIGCLMP